MSEDLMKQVKSLAFVVLTLSAVMYVYYYGRSIDQTYSNKIFSVDGDAKMETVPDIATFSVSVVIEGGQDVAAIQRQNVDKMNAIDAFLNQHGVEKKDLQTSQYTLSPRYSYPSCPTGETCPPPSISGYTLNQTLAVKVRKFESLGDILSGIVNKGANTVSGVSFTVDDDTDAKQVARTEAIAKAQKKAQEIAKAGNFKLGKLVSLDENSGGVPLTGVAYGGAMDRVSVKAETAVTPTIEPGTQSGTVQVTLMYEIIN